MTVLVTEFLIASILSGEGALTNFTGFEAQLERKKARRIVVGRIFFTLPPRALIIRQFYTI